MDNRTNYYLLLADLKGSSALPADQSRSVMELLLPELERQNDRAGDDLVYPLEVNYGDEFAGLFSSPHQLNQIVSDVRDMLRPQGSFRFVVAYGRIGYAGGTIREMGGPVFETAARALSALKKARLYGDWHVGEPETNLALNAMTNAANTMVAEMTEYQHEVFLLHKKGLSGQEIAVKLSKNPRSISSAKKTGHAKIVIQLEAAIDAMLKQLGERADD